MYYEGLQDKLTQAKDARAALDALREEHSERVRREAEEAERQRQIQMAHKLEIMRKKKQEYLQYQRQLAMQRMQVHKRRISCFALSLIRGRFIGPLRLTRVPLKSSGAHSSIVCRSLGAI